MNDCVKCNNKFKGIRVCDIYENMHANHVYESIEEMDDIAYSVLDDYDKLFDWVIYATMHGIDRYDMNKYRSISCESEYEEFLDRYWTLNDKTKSRVKWLSGLIVKYKEPYYTDKGEYEQIVIIPEFRKYGEVFDSQKYCISYRVDVEEFFN